MLHEDWDEGYEPPESETYAGSCDVPVLHISVSTKMGTISLLREQLANTQEQNKCMAGAILDVSKLLSRQHLMHHGDFITELSGIITAAVLIGQPTDGGVRNGSDLKAVHAFLMGESPLEGVQFGDKHPTKAGAFWWRLNLRAALAKG